MRSRALASFRPAGLLLLALAALPLEGATEPAKKDPAAPTAPAAPTPETKKDTAAATPDCSDVQAQVTGAYKEVRGKGDAPAQKLREVSLGDVLTVEIEGLPALLACKKPIILFLDERPLKDLTPYPPTDAKRSVLRFVLRRPTSTATTADANASREVWTYLFGSPQWAPRSTAVSVGLADRAALPSHASIDLAVIPHGPFELWLGILAVILVGFLVLAIQSNLLRDPASTPTAGTRPPYSLSRTQAAWWFFIVLASYLFIGLITADFGTGITGTVLTLLGISAGTLVGAALIDSSRSDAGTEAEAAHAAQSLDTQVKNLKSQVQTAEAQLANSGDTATAEQAKQAMAAHTSDLKEKESQLKKVRNQSEQFLLDILSDANGVTFHRFQIAAWTLVLGLIFIHEVYKVLAMPTFDGSLLTLMGISSATFLGMKGPEPKVPKT
jgi:hypothetical protein